MARIAFNSDEHDSNMGFEPVPPGKYVMMISNSDVRAVKNNPGNKYIWLEHTILDGQYKDRKIFNNLNLWNSNAQAVKIAETALAALCKATGKRAIQDTAELHNLPFTAEVDVEKREGYSAQNKIMKYIHEDSGTTSPATPRPSGPPTTGAPWRNG